MDRHDRTSLAVYAVCVVVMTAWIGLAEIEAWGLASRFGKLQHLAAVAGATPPLIGAWWAARRWTLPARWEIALLLIGALAIRGVLWFEPLEGTTDGYRYMWDGKVQDAGINPYLHAPKAPELVPLREHSFYADVYKKRLPTCYPPVCEAWFWVGYRLDRLGWSGWKAVLLLHELVSVVLIWLLLRRKGIAGGQATVYALAPLAAVMHMVGMHLDGLYVPWLAAALLLARDRPGAAGAAAMVATMVRPLAIALVPALMWGRRWREAAWVAAGATVTALACLLPYAEAGRQLIGSIPEYMMNWEFNGAIYGVMKMALHLDAQLARTVGYVATCALALFCVTRTRWSVAARFAGAVGAYYLLAPTVYPWYMPMVLVPWVLLGGFTPLMLGLLVMISDTVFVPHAKGLPWRVPTHMLILEWGGLAFFMALDLLLWVRRRGRGAEEPARVR
jgi:alpha-1,6-mannosyltransferase